MPDLFKPSMQDLAPYKALVISNSGTGTGTGDGGGIKTGDVLETPPGQRNIVFTVMRPIMVIFIRAAKTYVSSITGLFMVGGAVPKLVGATDLASALYSAATLSLAPAACSVLLSLGEWLTDLSQKYPKLSV